jgi:ribonuclease BN (tRNA processing enzyme)
MIINVIATGSAGNQYELIDDTGNSMLIEAGVPRHVFMKNREGTKPPEMVIVSHEHGDHSFWANEFKMICPVHLWKPEAVSENWKALGFQVEHGDVLNYAYLIKSMVEDKFLFFATDLQYNYNLFNRIFFYIQRYKVQNFLIELNYNDYLYKLADENQRIGCDRHFSDNDVVRFIRKSEAEAPKIITIHGSNRLSADTYTKKYLSGKLPTAKVFVATGAKQGIKDIYKI